METKPETSNRRYVSKNFSLYPYITKKDIVLNR
jgi:hypothetical protein